MGWLGRERFGEDTSGSKSKTIPGSDEMVEFTNQSVIPDLDQELSASLSWEQSVLKRGWPTKSKNEIERSEVGEEERENEGALGLRLTTAAPLLDEDELLIKVLLRFFHDATFLLSRCQNWETFGFQEKGNIASPTFPRYLSILAPSAPPHHQKIPSPHLQQRRPPPPSGASGIRGESWWWRWSRALGTSYGSRLPPARIPMNSYRPV